MFALEAAFSRRRLPRAFTCGAATLPGVLVFAGPDA